MTKTVRPLRGGQITIPIEFRRKLGIGEDTLLQMSLDGDELRIRRVRVSETAQGSPWFKELYDFFAPARQEAIEKGYTDEEINEAIDAAVRAVRQRHG